MPTSIPLPASLRPLSIAESKYRAEQVSRHIAFGWLVAWALSMLLISILTMSDAGNAALDAFNLALAY